MPAPNEITIRPRPYVFSITPVYARVKPGYEPLVVKVDWTQNKGFWNKVVVKRICDPEDRPCGVFPDHLEFDLLDPGPQKMLFETKVEKDVECKFSVEQHRVDPAEVFEDDPGVILQPGP